MIRLKNLFRVLVLALLLGACTKTEQPGPLPRSVPEAEGVSSQAIINFLDAAGRSKHEFHSFMFLRHGRVIAEGWWNPYRSDLKHTLYSTSKSFTSTAIGFAVTEKRITVNDKLTSFFPQDLPDSVSPNLASLTVKDLLTMSAGQDPEPTTRIVTTDDWVKSFLATPVVHEPGTVFLYNSTATFMLSAIVQKVTGEKVIDYLKPRLFDPLGITGMDWEVSPKGINTGGWGLRLKTEDMAKFGQLLLQKGNWHGKQVIPAAWVEEATTKKIDQPPQWIAPGMTKDSSDWTQGYCYQFWRARHHAFRADGAYGQFIIVLPDEDAVIAITCETPDMQGELNLVWNYLLPGIQQDKLPVNESLEDTLKQKLSSLALPLPAVIPAPSLEQGISGKSFARDTNRVHMNMISFHFMEGMCHVTLKIDTAIYSLAFGSGHWEYGDTTLPGPYLFPMAKSLFAGLPPFRIAEAYRWADPQTLELTLRYIESPHTETILCHFDKSRINMELRESFNPGKPHSVIKGQMMK